MKIKQILAVLLLLPTLLVSLSGCGKGKNGDPLDGPVENFDGNEENECFFGSAEELRGLYDAINGGDEAVKAYVSAREKEKGYGDDLFLINSAAKARFLMKELCELPLPVFREEKITYTHYVRSIKFDDSEKLTGYQINYYLNEDRRMGKEEFIDVTIYVHASQDMINAILSFTASNIVHTAEIDGYEAKIYFNNSIDNKDKIVSVGALFIVDDILVTASIPVKDNAKEGIARIMKMHITDLPSLLGVKNEKEK